jgi:nucleoid-associated protein YgaU
MPKDDVSHLPPDVQASIKASKKQVKQEDASPGFLANLPEQARAAMQKAAEKKAAAKTYVVQSGDSLSKIAKELLGDAARWPEIFELNKDQIEDPNLIRVGQELRIP